MNTIKRIPKVSSLPWLGSALPIAKNAPAFFLREHLKHGSVFEFSVLGQPMIVLAGRDANQFATREGAACFSSKESWDGLNAAYGTKETLISRDGPEHKKMRKIQKNGYARNRLEGKVSHIVQMTQRELERFVGTPTSVLHLLQRIISLQLGYLTMGVQRNDRLEDLCEFLRTTLACTVTKQRPQFLLKTPSYKRAKRNTMDFARDLLASVDPQADHLLADILRAHRQDPEFLPESELVSNALAPFVAGLDTAASTLAFCMYHLSQNPYLLRSVQRESDTYLGGDLSVAELAKAKCTYGTVLETLRINPIAPAMARKSTQSFEFDGFRIPANASVILATTVTHHDPRYFPKPQTFDIRRYEAPRAEHRQVGAYVPFGVGPHICLGAGLAQALMLLNLNIITSSFSLNFHGVSKGLATDHVPTMRPASSFKVTLSPRKARLQGSAPTQLLKSSLHN